MMKLFTMSCAAMAAAGTAGEELTFGQKMSEGAITLVLGMGTVFAVLIFLWIIIAAVGKAIGVTQKTAEKKVAKPEPTPAAAPAPAAVPAPVAPVQSDLSEAELVAVMTAAIAAFGGESAATRIRIRSVRRTTNWNK